MARTCVRLALIDAGFVDANKLKIKCRPYAQPQSIVDVVRKNLASKQAAQNKTRASLKNTDRPFTLHRRTGTSVSTTPLACTTRSMASVPQDSSSSDSSKAKLSERIANQTAVDQGTSGRILRAGGTNRTSIVDFGAPSDSETEERTTRHLSSSIRRKRGYHTENTSPFDEAGPLNIKRQRASHYNSLSLLDDLDGIAIPKPNAAARAALEDQIRELKETKAALAADIDDKEEKLERHAEFIAELQHEAAGYQEQIQDLTKQNDNLTKQKGSLASQNDSLTKQNESLSTQTNSQSARIDNLFKQNQGLFDRVEAQSEKLSKVMLKNDELEEFKSAHVMHSQPVLLELMTRKNRTNGSDEERAALDARVQYRDIYGVDPVE
ncbi:hypothetical protein P153DRAFT_370683 [Dothidotthia symphoricarpi CBS 119687]|uniref:Uncharacterized protein n=1 Tax=Dothidotthia symphoricarpi CBS 119687 TaxID=1392245 RepID=A0A6A5ZYY1_9PLEO|nr:uncharacterized protein P153DRAFT_370683 [Dothidotthia symphoricarpi CBS 119687]KAF2124769.1 hypothetical protein P153DRAFT_370683 [Dothidotthia symphoricarpi CBS 119687]